MISTFMRILGSTRGYKPTNSPNDIPTTWRSVPAEQCTTHNRLSEFGKRQKISQV